MRIYPAPHYTMGGLWVDYDLDDHVPGLFAIGEANFSDHGANRLGASASCRGSPTGTSSSPSRWGTTWRVHPGGAGRRSPAARRRREVEACRLGSWGTGSPDRGLLPQELGRIMWDHCGMARNEAGLRRRSRRSPSSGRSSGRTSASRKRGHAEPVAREGRARGRLPGVRRGHVPRCPHARRIVRGPLPGGARHRRRRGQAGRRELRPRGRLGIPGVGERPSVTRSP
jgi:hypothetical protein